VDVAGLELMVILENFCPFFGTDSYRLCFSTFGHLEWLRMLTDVQTSIIWVLNIHQYNINRHSALF
jgi:hypothetical protein